MLRRLGPVFELPTLENRGWPFVDRINASIMGGLSWAAQAFAKPKPGERIVYLDVNSLYPTAMQYPLPVGAYRRVEGDLMAVCQQLLGTWQVTDDTGYLIVCDFHVPSEFHDVAGLPPVCKMAARSDTLSPEQHLARQLCNREGYERDERVARPLLGRA